MAGMTSGKGFKFTGKKDKPTVTTSAGSVAADYGEEPPGEVENNTSGGSGLFSSFNAQTAFQTNIIQSQLQAQFGIDASTARSYINYWADGFYNDETKSFEGLEFGDQFTLGAMGIAGVRFPNQFIYNGQAYDSSSGLPRPVSSNVPIGIAGQGSYPPYLQGVLEKGRNKIALDTPVLTDADFEAMLKGINPGGGGGGRRDIVLDRDQVIEGVRGGWQAYLLDTPGNAGELADRYIAEAVAFARKGGQLDFQTWLLNQMRTTSRYQSIYKNKPESLNEAEFIGQYSQAVGQFGLPTRQADAATIRGAANAAAPQAFVNSLARTREVQAMGTGRVSRQFANLLNQNPGLRA